MTFIHVGVTGNAMRPISMLRTYRCQNIDQMLVIFGIFRTGVQF